MEALTIEQLNIIDTLKNKQIFEQEKLDKEVAECLSDVASILKMEWHNKNSEWYNCTGHFYVWNQKPFSIVAEMYRKNGIEITYYQPHRNFSFKLRA